MPSCDLLTVCNVHTSEPLERNLLFLHLFVFIGHLIWSIVIQNCLQLNVMDRETGKIPSGPTARRPLASRAERQSSPKTNKSKPRTQSPALNQSSSPYSLRTSKRNRNEISGDFGDSDLELESSSKFIEEQQIHSHSYNSTLDTDIDESRASADRSVSVSYRSVKYQSGSLRTEPMPTAATNSDAWKYVAIAVIAVLVFLVYGWKSQHLLPAKEPISCPEFKELPKHFLHQEMLLWKSLKIGIENVLNENPAKPSVFLLAHSDHTTMQKVMTQILNATAHCMQSNRPIQLNGATFATAEMINDYGVFIAKYRDELTQEKIMYVSDVNETPAAAAQVFHAFCDTVEPLVSKAVIFFTVYLEPGNYEHSTASVSQKVEQILEHNWSNDVVSENTVKALIGRVTDQVFLLHSEKSSM